MRHDATQYDQIRYDIHILAPNGNMSVTHHAVLCGVGGDLQQGL